MDKIKSLIFLLLAKFLYVLINIFFIFYLYLKN